MEVFIQVNISKNQQVTKRYDDVLSERMRDMDSLRQTLDQKSVGFSDSTKNSLGYYFMMDLIDRVPQLNFRNYNQFYREFSIVVREYPVANNGLIRFGDYLEYLFAFRKYIRKEFGFVHRNRTFNRRFWQWFVLLFIGLAIAITPLLGAISSFLPALFLASWGEQISREKNIVLGLSPQDKELQIKRKNRKKRKAFQE
ncbi:hypothetical protein [Capnocytophaga sp.]|uniref:hypothetical protein n=1 Tax=Capnocytophaga sp. TaxID=44737 RepID=UPI0026DC8B11|nr:hypothetical protein [Capnocytophaga sp.]MDO5104375.1 hypothetical protein [Capnocytophaga sp.]